MMTENEHSKTVCKVCETTIQQCRCANPNKMVRWVVCAKCSTLSGRMIAEALVDQAFASPSTTVAVCAECLTEHFVEKIRHWTKPPTGWWVRADGERWICGKCAKRLNP